MDDTTIINTVFFVFLDLSIVNAVISTLVYFLNYVFMIVHIFSVKKIRNSQKQIHVSRDKLKFYKYCIIIAAHNEEKVIIQLINSIRNQTYKNFDVYVVCDNCTDNTVRLLKENKVNYFERYDLNKKGVNFAIQYGYKQLEKTDKKYDYYFQFDADNLLDKNYLENVNNVICSKNFVVDLATTYRNSKNFGSSWVSSGYSIEFMRESIQMNGVRDLFKWSQFINGTGWCMSRKVLEETKFLSLFNTMSFDIELTCWLTKYHFRSIYIDSAIFYDEQPITFRASWRQRMRWTVGIRQVGHLYLNHLLSKSIINKKTDRARLDYWDKYIIVLSGFWIFLANIVVNGIPFALSFYTTGLHWVIDYQIICWIGVFAGLYLSMFFLGMSIVITEWKRIKNTPNYKKVLSMFTFPFFINSYILISFVAMFKKTYSTTPIARNILININDIQ